MNLSSSILQRLARSQHSPQLLQLLSKSESKPQRQLTPLQERARQALQALVQANQKTILEIGAIIPPIQLQELIISLVSSCDDESIINFCVAGSESMQWVLNGETSKLEETTEQSLSE